MVSGAPLSVLTFVRGAETELDEQGQQQPHVHIEARDGRSSTCEGEPALRKTSSAFLLLSKGPPLAPETREDSPNAVRPRPPG